MVVNVLFDFVAIGGYRGDESLQQDLYRPDAAFCLTVRFMQIREISANIWTLSSPHLLDLNISSRDF